VRELKADSSFEMKAYSVSKEVGARIMTIHVNLDMCIVDKYIETKVVLLLS
jgi:hypothetical protein